MTLSRFKLEACKSTLNFIKVFHRQAIEIYIGDFREIFVL